MSVFDLATSAAFIPEGVCWHFPTSETAVVHLRRYEKLIADWAARFGMRRAIVTGGDDEFPITPRLSDVAPDVLPIAAAPFAQNDGDLLIAQQWLNSALLDVLIEMRQQPDRIIALVNWESQRQVVMTSGCEELTLGDRLEDCIKYSRRDYWLGADLDDFFRECRQSLRQDGSNEIEFRYHTFEPSTGDDWKLCVARYRMINAGNLGMFQLGRNVGYERLASPIAR